MPPAPAPDPSTPPAPTPDAKPPVPVFAGMVQIRIYSDLISTGSEGGQFSGIDPAKVGRIQSIVGSIDGVSGVSVNSVSGTLDASYSGPYDKIEDIEKAVSKIGVNCTLISPAIVKFRPYNQDNDAKVVSALQGVSGSVGVAKIAGNFCLFIPAESLDLTAVLDACKNAGYPGTIISHDLYEHTFTKAGDTAKLEKSLSETKFVIKSQVDLSGNKVSVTVVRGRCSKAQVKKLLESCGFDAK
jgi:copper chaperone CopZ